MPKTDRFPKTFTIAVTEDIVARYAAVSGDINPLHLSQKAAREAGFQQQVTHGMLLMALSTNQISPLLGKTWRIHKHTTKFVAPLYVNEKFTVKANVLEEQPNEIRLKITGINEQDKTVIRGKIVLRQRK
jgi:acyl dehydratase